MRRYQTSLATMMALTVNAALLALLGRRIVDLCHIGFTASQLGSAVGITLAFWTVVCVGLLKLIP